MKMNHTAQPTGVKVRTHCQVGYETIYAQSGGSLNESQKCNNQCINEKNARTGNGTASGKELEKCMSYCWGPWEISRYRESGGRPFEFYDGNTELGTKCFNEFISRYKNNSNNNDFTTASGLANREEWFKCLNTIP